MTQKPGKNRRSSAPRDEALGHLPPGSSDTGSATTDAEGNIDIKPNAGASAAAKPESLVLPEGGLVVIRKSGGLRFTSRTVAVFRDGHVTTGTQASDTPSGGSSSTPVRRLSDAELVQLYRALDAAGLPELPSSSGRQNPDAYAYEIVAHLEGRDYSVEVFDGSMPKQVAPLIQLLMGFAQSAE